MSAELQLETKQVIDAAMVDSDFYGRYFFPKTCSQKSPLFHREMWDSWEHPDTRQAITEAFRGSAKTSKARIFTSKRIAYAISRTILFISDTETHAAKSGEWIMRNIEYNTRWTQTFGLRKGRKWTPTDMEIIHEVCDTPIRLLALGVQGQVRGINIEDYRPDFILLDDPQNDENVATPEGREKLMRIITGAILRSLAPDSENPDALFLMLQTPMYRDDIAETFRHDPSFVSRRYSCFDSGGESRWPERYPTESLLKEKQSYINRNQLSVWMREMECKVISAETAAFRTSWLHYYDVLPEGCVFYIAIDPASSDSKTADYQACVVLAVRGADVFVDTYTNVRGEDPEEFILDVIRLIIDKRPMAIAVEAIAYQRVLAKLLRSKMTQHRAFTLIHEIKEHGRKKKDRIIQAITGRASNGHLYFRREHTELIQQYHDYPDVSHEDLLDALSMGLEMISPTLDAGDTPVVLPSYKPLEWQRAAP